MTLAGNGPAGHRSALIPRGSPAFSSRKRALADLLTAHRYEQLEGKNGFCPGGPLAGAEALPPDSMPQLPSQSKRLWAFYLSRQNEVKTHN